MCVLLFPHSLKCFIMKKITKQSINAEGQKFNKNLIKSYRELSRNKQGFLHNRGTLKGTLKAIIPLAAASIIPTQSLQAQCLNSSTNSKIGACTPAISNAYINLDMDSDPDLLFNGFSISGNNFFNYSMTYGGKVYRSFIYTEFKKWYAFGMGGGGLASTAFSAAASNVINCATKTFQTYFPLFAEGLYTRGKQLQTGGGGWNNISSTSFANTYGVATPGHYNFVVQSNDGSCGWLELEFGLSGGTMQFCFYSGGVESINGGTDGVGTFKLGDCSTLDLPAAPLPVDLVNLKVEIENLNANLTWSTMAEIENRGFEIQRSYDGINFEKAGFIEGVGNSDQKVDYQFTDKNLRTNQLIYYRLKQIDFNGKFEISNVISTKIIDEDVAKISDAYPNPVAGGNIKIDVDLIEGEVVDLQLYDSFGKLVLNQTGFRSSGKSTIEIKTKDLAKGIHFAKVAIGNVNKYLKINNN